jgi:hypothetical protein
VEIAEVATNRASMKDCELPLVEAIGSDKRKAPVKIIKIKPRRRNRCGVTVE